jgi:hypothetical protein
MQGKYRIRPEPAPNVALVIMRELDEHHKAMEARKNGKQPHSNSILSAAYAPITDEKCCVVQ